MKSARGKLYVVAHTGFTVGETLYGWQHLGRGVARRLLRRPATFFLNRYQVAGQSPEAALNLDGTTAVCQVCGYCLVRVQVGNGWLVEMCSGLPVLVHLSGEKFDDWVSSLPSSELPMSRV